MGQAGAGILPSPPPVDLNKYKGTWYEQGSVKQFFSFGLVNTKAVYTPQPDGSIKVQNSGNYFGPNGPQSNITGAALVVNPDFNTRLNVGFFFGQPNNTNEPGNYWILDYGPVVDGQYQWAIVSDSGGSSGLASMALLDVDEIERHLLVDRVSQRFNARYDAQLPAFTLSVGALFAQVRSRRPSSTPSEWCGRSFPHQTPRKPLTERRKRVSLLSSMCVWVARSPASASVPAMRLLRNAPFCAIVGRCAGCLLPTSTRT